MLARSTCVSWSLLPATPGAGTVSRVVMAQKWGFREGPRGGVHTRSVSSDGAGVRVQRAHLSLRHLAAQGGREWDTGRGADRSLLRACPSPPGCPAALVSLSTPQGLGVLVIFLVTPCHDIVLSLEVTLQNWWVL